ncbi:MAG: hypothetical protein Ct9H300mP12_06250 [Acidimicrobiales bacterium]|nr:MAG: hypothetical protein Ct9H300mP12_06250 [Acidimicrobiales bacterium]
MQTASMRRSIDDYPFQETDYPPNYEDDELTPISWAVGIRTITPMLNRG